MGRIFGFDIGTTSIGSAVVDWDEASAKGRIAHLGVRIFPEGITEKLREPRNKARRTARQLRRQLRRRRLRRRTLNEELARLGLLPAFGTPEWAEAMGVDPYELRKEGMRRALGPFELGRALYHLVKRRGFRPRDERGEFDAGDAQAKKEEGVVKESLEKLSAEMGDRTLGAFLAAQEKKRGRYLGRGMIDNEFRALWHAQAPHHPGILSEANFTRLHNIAFHQRPVFWRVKTLGHCDLMPGRSLCPRAAWAGQRFRMLQMLNSLRLVGGNARRLTEDEREKVLAKLQRREKMPFDSVRKTIGLPTHEKFNLEIGGEKRLLGNATEAALIGIFGKSWDELPAHDRIRVEISERLWHADYRLIGNAKVEIRSAQETVERRQKLAQSFQVDWNIDAEHAKALAALELPGGWLRHSKAAIERLLPQMESGVNYGDLINGLEFADWRRETFPDRNQATGEIFDFLPSHPKSMPDVRNPTVNRALNELRKVANNLVRAFGKPDLIRIELTRELRQPRKEREAASKRMRDQEVLRKKAIADLRENGFAEPSEDQIRKWLLWHECDKTCPYTGARICFDDLFRTGRFQIEHIFPRSRSLDNGLGNKTLCESTINKDKSNRTPFEYFQGRPEEWELAKSRLAALVKKGFPEAKARRFQRETYQKSDEEDFAERQLRDTGYIARAARDFLKQLFPDTEVDARRVESCNGRATAQLRRRWNLNGLVGEGEGKDRSDHRHHAVDAVAVACATRAYVKRLSDAYRDRELGKPMPEIKAPWGGFREEAAAALGSLVVSHRVQGKASGRLHEQTTLGDTGEAISAGGVSLRRFVKRKPVGELSEGEIDLIRDKAVRELIQAKVAEAGGNLSVLKTPLRMPARAGNLGPEIRHVRLFVDRQIKVMASLKPENRAFAEQGQGSNHHIAIYDKAGKADHETLTLIDVRRRIAAKEPIVRRRRPDGAQFVISLAPGDTLEEIVDGRPRYWVVRKFNEKGRVFYKAVTSVGQPKPEVSFGPGRFLQPGIRKVKVDPIGRVTRAAD